jgi:hypothetical protein
MSKIAAAVVFHPNVNRSLKLWSTTVGRDKVRGNFLSIASPPMYLDRI